eukprot:scaffold921_cov397-Prasinococcus_capsulatus_cf.AAC.19
MQHVGRLYDIVYVDRSALDSLDANLPNVPRYYPYRQSTDQVVLISLHGLRRRLILVIAAVVPLRKLSGHQLAH